MKKETDDRSDNIPTGLNRGEYKDAVRRSAPKAAVVYEAIRREGEEELARSSWTLVWSGLAAGLSMGFSFLTEALLAINLPDLPWRTLISKFGYSIGFLIVVLGRQQLFTENTLTPVLQLLHRQDFKTLLQVIRLWATVLGANVVGAFLFAVLVVKAGLFSGPIEHVFSELAGKAFASGFFQTVVSGIFAGWLIALMVWLLPFAESARVMVIIIITYIVGLGGFAHIVAGSVNAFYALINGDVSVSLFGLNFFIPALLGNIIGGITFVSAVNYAQVRPDKHTDY
jgi:formate/nitrite transporter FocA (FNT family)